MLGRGIAEEGTGKMPGACVVGSVNRAPIIHEEERYSATCQVKQVWNMLQGYLLVHQSKQAAETSSRTWIYQSGGALKDVKIPNQRPGIC